MTIQNMTEEQILELAVENADTVLVSMEMIAEEILAVAGDIEKDQIFRMLEYILDTAKMKKKIFVSGAGRSGLVGKAFAMRLMHLGFDVYVVGEATTPAVREGDLVVLITGSGQTRSIAEIGEVTAKLGARLITISSKTKSVLAGISDVLVVLPTKSKDDPVYKERYTERHLVGDYSNLVPMGTSFEIMSMIFLDSVIAELIQVTKSTEEEMKRKHANTE